MIVPSPCLLPTVARVTVVLLVAAPVPWLPCPGAAYRLMLLLRAVAHRSVLVATLAARVVMDVVRVVGSMVVRVAAASVSESISKGDYASKSERRR